VVVALLRSARPSCCFAFGSGVIPPPARRSINEVVAAAQARLRRLTPAEAAQAVRDGATLIDTRDGDVRVREGTIPGAVHVPLSVLEWRVDPDSGHQSPALAGREDRLILICREGYSSSLAAVRLHDLGFTNTTDVIGGFVAWAAAGLPVTREPDGEAPRSA
jgi:rhodanese-related sulfurtransferase